MQGMDCPDDCRFHGTQLLGVSVGGDADPHNIEEERFKSGSGISVLALGGASDLD